MDISKQNNKKISDLTPNKAKSSHKVELDHLHSMSVTGVVDVPTFTDKLVNVRLNNESMQIVGVGLTVKNIDVESGVLLISGQVNMIKYSTSTAPTSLIKRILK